MPIQRVSRQFKQIQQEIENQSKKRSAANPEEETQYVDKQRGISVVLDAEGGSGNLKEDIKKSGLEECEDDGTIPYELYLKQAEYFLGNGQHLKCLNRLNLALRVEPGSSLVLCTRSRCNLKLGRWREALRDAEEVLNRQVPAKLNIYHRY